MQTAGSNHAPKPAGSGGGMTAPEVHLLVFAGCGWLVLVANMFGRAGRTGWIVPVVDDIAGLAASTLLLALAALTPGAVRRLLAIRGRGA